MHQPQTDCDELGVVIPAAGARFVAEDGTVSVVLEEAVDANYSPTEEEIEEFAEWMGMKLPEDKEFLYIASEALRARLPKDWRACRTDGDEVYYFNFRTGESTWKHPMDDFYRQKFLEKKELKKKGGAKRETTTTTTTGGGGALHVENDNGSGINNRSGSNNNNTTTNNNNSNTAGGGGGPVSILKKLPADLAGGTSTTATLTHTFVPPLGPTSRALPSTSPRDSRLVADVFKLPTSTSHAGGERRIVSEAERNLEEKLRREREAAFVAEEEKAEAAHRERLQEMRRAHEEEVKKLQSKLEEKRVLIEKQTASNDGEEHAGKEREELVKRLRKSIDENLQEEKDLQQKLLKIKEQHAQRVASAVAKVETAAKEKYERERKDLQAELAASQKKLESETQAEFAAKRAELQKKSQEELQRLKEDAERRHQIEMKALRERYTKEQKSVDNTVEGKGGKTCLHAKEKEMVAAIENKSKKDQAEFSATMEATLRRLRRELCELEGPVTVTLGNSTNTSQINEVLDPVRRHWKDEERKRMQTLEEERRNKLASVERMQPPSSVSSSSPVSTTKSTTTTTNNNNNNNNNNNSVEGIRAANEAILAAKEKYLEETEMLLRTTLQEELAHSDLALDVQIQEAVKDDVKVFVRSTEVRRKLEREDFERRRDAALAENKKAKELYEKRVAEQMAKLEEESRVEMEEMMSEAVQGEVEKIVRAMTVEREAAERKLKQRYADERGVLFAEVDEEMAAYEKEERGNIFSQEESKAKKRETEMRLSAEKAASMEEVQQQRMKEKTNKKKEEGEGERDVMSAEMTQQQQQQRASTSSSSLVVPAEMLRRRLSLIEQTYGEQELALQMELESINAELRRLENAIALQRQRPPQQQSRQQSTINDNNNTSMLPEASPRVASPFSKREKGHASPFASEALRILNQQQQELNARRGALHAAREEWKNGLWYASSSVPSILHSGKPLVPNSHAEGNDVNAKLLRVVEALSSRLKEITGCITKMQTTSESPTLHWRQGQKLYSSSDCHHRDRGKDAHGKNYSQKRKWRGKSADAAQRLHQSRSKTQDPAVRLIRKWSQILLEFAVPSQHHSEVSDSIQRLVTYK